MKSIYYIITLIIGVIFLNGCETDTNGPMPDTFEEAGVAYMVLDESSSGLINLNDLDAFNFTGTIDVLFDPAYDKLSLMVAYNGDHDNAAVLVDDIASTPHDFSVSMNDLISAVTAIGSAEDIEIGDYFVFYVNVTIGGKVYPVYKMVSGKAVKVIGSGVLSSLAGLEGSEARTDVRIDVPCGYDVEKVTGDYIAYSGPWLVEGPVTITADPDDPFVVNVSGLAALDGLVEDEGPLQMNIDPNSYNVSVPKQVLATDAWGVYHDFSYQGSGRLNTCDGVYTMDFVITVREGTFGGPWPFTLTPAE
jgi:hypothetical protein